MMYFEIIKSPIFIIGIIIKIYLITLSNYSDIFYGYISFIDLAIQNPINAWQNWVLANGSDSVFPYGYVMLYVFLPLFSIVKLIQLNLSIAYFVTLLVFDFILLITLLKIFSKRKNLTIFLYWLSPIILYSTYYRGFNDLIPTCMMILSFFHLKKCNFKIAGALIACAISAKISIILVIPVFFFYFYSSKDIIRIVDFLKTFMPLMLIFFLPIISVSEHWQMILNNPDIPSLWNMRYSFSDSLSFYLMPALFLLLIYNIWRIKKINFDLLMMQAGILLLGISLFSFAPPGWFVWSLPFLIFFQINDDKYILAALGLIFHFLLIYTHLPNRLDFEFIAGHNFSSLIFTFFLFLGSLLIFKMWRDGVRGNDYFRSSVKPISIGIVGNSGVGKDLLATNLTNIFGDNVTTHISGDNYHRWDRKKSLWKSMTHLNPAANNMAALTEDILKLINGKSILQKTYDHSSGLLTKAKTTKANNILITSGLHTLYNFTLREMLDIKIFIGMSDNLRMWFKSKRDTGSRGHTLKKILEKEKRRLVDYEKFIVPQKSYSDVAFSIYPLKYKGSIPLTLNQIPKQYIAIEVPEGFDDYNFCRMLSGFCSLHIEVTHKKLGEKKNIRIEGEIHAEDIEIVAKNLCKRSIDFISSSVVWADGTQGIMQLVILMILEDKLQQRLAYA